MAWEALEQHSSTHTYKLKLMRLVNTTLILSSFFFLVLNLRPHASIYFFSGPFRTEFVALTRGGKYLSFGSTGLDVGGHSILALECRVQMDVIQVPLVLTGKRFFVAFLFPPLTRVLLTRGDVSLEGILFLLLIQQGC